jgi:hypothetical protein
MVRALHSSGSAFSSGRASALGLGEQGIEGLDAAIEHHRQSRGPLKSCPPGCAVARFRSVNLAQPRFAASCCLAQLSASRDSEKSW